MHPAFKRIRHRLLQIFAPGRLTWDENFRPPWALHGQGKVEVGARTYWFGDTVLSAWKQTDSVTIGSYCSIASGAQVMAGGNHLVGAISAYPFTMIDRWREWNAEPQPSQAITIGNDVWIGARAMVVGDVTVGDGAVIGAGALVVRDIPPYCVAVGVPARVVRKRFSEREIQTLQELAWWKWPEEKVLEAEEILRSDDVARLVTFARQNALYPAGGQPTLSEQAATLQADASLELS